MSNEPPYRHILTLDRSEFINDDIDLESMLRLARETAFPRRRWSTPIGMMEDQFLADINRVLNKFYPPPQEINTNEQ
jgi:hypothetical protein